MGSTNVFPPTGMTHKKNVIYHNSICFDPLVPGVSSPSYVNFMRSKVRMHRSHFDI